MMPIDNGTMNLFRNSSAPISYTLTKSGSGTLTLTGADAYTGGTVVSAGTLVLGGGGTITTSNAVTVAAGATLLLDNSTNNNTNRLGDAAPITLSGGTLALVGNASGTTENVGTLTLAAGTASVLETSSTGGGLASLVSLGLNRLAGATVSFIGLGGDLGTATNNISFTSLPNGIAGAGANGILPYATVQGPAGLDLTTDADGDPTTGPFVVGRVTSYANDVNAAGADVKLTGAAGDVTTLTGSNAINALLIVGNNITVNAGGNTLTVASGQVVTAGTGNVVTGGTVAYAAAEPLFFVQGANAAQTVTLNNATSGSFTLTFNGQTTAPLAFNAAASDVAAALAALSNVGLGKVLVTLLGNVFTLIFQNALAGGALPQIAANSFLNPGATITTAVTNPGGGTLTVSGAITGTGAMRKERLGTLVLSGDDSGFAGAGSTITVDQGVLNVQSNTALGDTAAGTTVNSGAELDIQNMGSDVNIGAEALTLNGTGYLNLSAGAGALRNVAGAANTWAGTVTIGSNNTFIGTDAGQLTLSGVVAFGNALNDIQGGAGRAAARRHVGQHYHDGGRHTDRGRRYAAAQQDGQHQRRAAQLGGRRQRRRRRGRFGPVRQHDEHGRDRQR